MRDPMSDGDAVSGHVAAETRHGVKIVDGQGIKWVNGAEVLATMAPQFRDNLGDPSRVHDLMAKYWLRPLWVDPETTRRIDHVRTDPGYQDLSEAYHESVEEALFLDGRVTLSAEGELAAGDYFWRPPGWVHSARSVTGFECLLMMEGDDATEGSGRVSRVVRDDEEAGQYAMKPPAGRSNPPIGPRGYVRRLETRFLPTERHEDAETRLVGPEAGPLSGRVLSKNVRTGGASVLVEIPAGWQSRVPAVDRERFLVIVNGSLTVDGQKLSACSLVRIAAGSDGPHLSTQQQARMLVKVGSRR